MILPPRGRQAWFAVLFLGGLGSWAATATKADPPNIVLIVSDDQGYRDLGCYGSQEVLTPRLDRLAADGVRLTNFYVAWPACTPSRGSLLTGRYPQRNGVSDMIRNEAPDYGKQYTPAEYEATFERIGGMDTREVLLPARLRDAGYVCGIFGKWDLGSLQRFLPAARGFDVFYGFVNTGIDYFTHERYGVPSMYRDRQPTTADRGEYCTNLFRREALRFLRRNHSRPFLLYLPFNAPHGASNLDPRIRTAAQAPPEYHALYPELAAQAGYERREYRYGGVSDVANAARRRLEYAASITCMDAAIGDILDELERLQAADNTMVIFLSDNGGGGGSDNSPLRGGKSQLFEGGVRVPCIWKFPGKLPPGRTSDAFLTALDVLPTLWAACGVSPPDGLVLDGADVLPTLAGQAESPRREMFWQRRSDKAARVDHWKWVESARGGGLFDLQSDPGEREDVSAQRPEVLRRVRRRFAAWQAEMEAAEPRGPFRDY